MKNPNWTIAVLVILYTVGIIGITLPLHPYFYLLTPINLLTSAYLLFLHHHNWDTKFYVALGIAFIGGLGAEWLGVHTGMVFGEYHYGDTLGPKIFEVPFMMGFNWLILIYSSANIARSLFEGETMTTQLGQAAIGASLMTALDVLIEPIAVQLDFWQWHQVNGNTLLVAPLQNYLAWWIISFAILSLFLRLVPTSENKVAPALFMLQFIFFGALIGLSTYLGAFVLN